MGNTRHKLSRIFFSKRFLFSAIVVLLLFSLIFAYLAEELSEHELNRFDDPIVDYMQSLISPHLTSFMLLFTFLGSFKAIGLIFLFTATFMLFKNKRWESVFLFIAMFGGMAFNTLLKTIFHRERPTLHRIIEETGYSFPSGHSMGSFIFYGLLGYFLFRSLKSTPGKTLTFLFFSSLIFLVGISRIYLGVHYPSDVIAGFAAGGAWLTVCIIGLNHVLHH